MRRSIIVQNGLASTLVVLLFAAESFASSGTIDFFADPGMTTQNPSSVLDPDLSLRTLFGVADITLNRESAVGDTERFYLPLPADYTSNSDIFRARFRFASQAASDNGNAIQVGFFSSDETNTAFSDVASDSATSAAIQGAGSNQIPGRYFGGHWERDTLGPISTETWYVIEFTFQPDETTVSPSIQAFDGGGVIPIDGIFGSPFTLSGSGITKLNQVGFGNTDVSGSDLSYQVTLDWMTWSVNEALPADPSYAPDAAATAGAIPEPNSVILLALGSMMLLVSIRKYSWH